MVSFQQLIEGTIPLYEENTALKIISGAPTQQKILNHIILQHDLLPYGILPKRKAVQLDLHVGSTLSFYERVLVERGLLLSVPLSDLLGRYCERTNGNWIIPESLKLTIGKDARSARMKINGTSLDDQEEYVKRPVNYFVALVARRDNTGRMFPVFGRIIPALPSFYTVSD
jgi:hypothetical protein